MDTEFESVQPLPTQALDRPEHRWRGRDITFFGLAFIALILIVPTIIDIVPVEGENADTVRALIGTLLLQLTLVAFVAGLVRGVYGLPFLKELRWTRVYSRGNGSLVLLGMTLAFAVMILSTLFPPDDPPIQQLLNTPEAVAMVAVYAVLFAPLLEEVIVRGFLFRVLEQMAGASIAVWTTAVVFGLLHVPQHWGSPAGMILIFGVGLVLSKVRHGTNSLVPPVIVHTAYNGMLFLAFLLGTLIQGSMTP